MNEVFERTENGTTTIVTIAEGLTEINFAMMGGKRNVREMSHGSTNTRIDYKDGRTVTYERIDAPEAATETEELADWTGTHSSFNKLHRFEFIGTDPVYGDQYRARCNKRIHPNRYPKGYNFETKSQVLAREHADLYTFCPRCEAK